MSGAISHRSGLAAEEGVARRYERSGASIVQRRWRGSRGEIDLIVREDDVTVFVEVKAAATHAQAAERLSAAQAGRIMQAAEEYLAADPAGMLSSMRFDVALVDAAGRVEILANALSA